MTKRDSGILLVRLTLGSYLAVHGAQKLFGAFGGPGLEPAGAFFEQVGLKPGKPFATLAAASELTGGVLTATGLAYPVGPVAIAGAMAVASSVHSDNGPMGQKGGYELPLTDMLAAVALALTGPGRYSLDSVFRLKLPRALVRLTVIGAAAISTYCTAKVLRQKRMPPAPAAVPGTSGDGAAAATPPSAVSDAPEQETDSASR
jgi:putative oxidoreductase